MSIRSDQMDAAVAEERARWCDYVALLREELAASLAFAFVHGWQSDARRLAAGAELRGRLGVTAGELDAGPDPRTGIPSHIRFGQIELSEEEAAVSREGLEKLALEAIARMPVEKVE